jgi:tripartite-type tricarboxylate transporter receptor subunit TctC
MQPSIRPITTHRRIRPALVVLAALGTVPLVSPAAAQSDFYRGQTVTIVVASGQGGFDTYARLLARHLGRFVPGNPSFVVQNMPGAGGLRAAGFLAKVAPKDGLTIGAVQATMVKAPLLGLAGADFDPTQFGWIGSLNSEVMVCVSWHTSPIKTIQDVMARELIVGGAGVGADTEQIPTALNNLIGTKFKIVSGYKDGGSVLLAMQRGEIDGRCGWSWSSVKVQHPEWVAEKKINVLTQVPGKHAELPDIATATDFAKSDEDKQVIDFLFGHLTMSRSYVTPPGVPADRVATLRAGFDAMVKDKAVVAEFARLHQELTPISGVPLEQFVKRIYGAPKPVVAKAAQAIEPPKK